MSPEIVPSFETSIGPATDTLLSTDSDVPTDMVSTIVTLPPTEPDPNAVND
jgi:hypothetical protein